MPTTNEVIEIKYRVVVVVSSSENKLETEYLVGMLLCYEQSGWIFRPPN